MVQFPIKINGNQVMSNDIYAYIKRGKILDAINYIMKLTGCTKSEAEDVISELQQIAQQGIKESIEKDKKPIHEKQTRIIDYTQQKIEINQPTCPTCGSTNLKKISTASKAVNTAFWGLLGTKRFKTFHCNNCGYEW